MMVAQPASDLETNTSRLTISGTQWSDASQRSLNDGFVLGQMHMTDLEEGAPQGKFIESA